MKKLAAVLLATLFFLSAFLVTVSAHSGRTDSNGGHYDHSTGEYHYHNGENAGKSNGSSNGDSNDSEYNPRLNVVAEVSGASDGAKQKERDIIYTEYFIKSYNDKLTSYSKNHIIFDYLYSKNQLSDFQLSSYSVPYDKYIADRKEWQNSQNSGYLSGPIKYNEAYNFAYDSTHTVSKSYLNTPDFYDQVSFGTVDGISYFNNRISIYQEAFPVKFFFILLTTCQLVALPLLIATILLTILFFIKFNFYSKFQNYSIKKQCIIAALYSFWISALLLIFVYPYLEFPKFEGWYEWSSIDVLHLIICLFSVFAFLRIHLVKKENGKYILRSNEEHEITVNNSVTIIESISLAILLFLLSFYINFNSEIANIEYVLIVFAIPIVLPFLYAFLIYGACLAIKLLFYCVIALISKVIDFSDFIKDILPSRKNKPVQSVRADSKNEIEATINNLEENSPQTSSNNSPLTVSKMMHELATENVKPYKMHCIGEDISAGTLYFAPSDESIRSFFESGDEIYHISQKNQRFFFTDGEIIYLYNCDVSTEEFK